MGQLEVFLEEHREMAVKAHHVPLVERSLETLKDKKTQRSGASDSFRISTQKSVGYPLG